MQKRGFTPLIKLLEEIGGWPVVQGDLWNENDQSWEDVVYEARKRGLLVNFPFEITTIRFNSTNTTHFREVLAVEKITDFHLNPQSKFVSFRYHTFRFQYQIIVTI